MTRPRPRPTARFAGLARPPRLGWPVRFAGPARLARPLALAVCGLALVGCAGPLPAAGAATAKEQPAKVEPLGDTGLKKLTLTAKAVQRLGIQTFPVVTEGPKRVIPYHALLYLPDGTPFTYTNPEGTVFVRHNVVVDRINGEEVLLNDGPPVDTRVVTAGGAELWGTEFGVK